MVIYQIFLRDVGKIAQIADAAVATPAALAIGGFFTFYRCQIS